MAYAVFQSDRALPQSADVLTYLPWLPNATKLPAGNSTATVIAQAIEYVDAGAISPRLKTWANKLGVILIPKRNVATPEGGLRDNWLERHSRAMMLIGRALTGWPVDVGSSLHGGISYVQLP
ncbi:hypothetical protein KJ807_05895, partial [Patescibacteria group bacterium]|nr:hypothetical protein [Patescibacteria group bacterium]